MFRLPSRPPAFLTPPLPAPPSLPPSLHPPPHTPATPMATPDAPDTPDGLFTPECSRGFRRGCRSRPATPSQATPPPALPFHRPPPRQHPVSAGWVYPNVQRWLARLSRCKTSRVALCARSPQLSHRRGSGFIARACRAPAFRGGSGTVSYGSHAYTRCRAERVLRENDARPHPATNVPDIHPRLGVDIRPRCSGNRRTLPARSAGDTSHPKFDLVGVTGHATRCRGGLTAHTGPIQPSRCAATKGGETDSGIGICGDVGAAYRRVARGPRPQ